MKQYVHAAPGSNRPRFALSCLSFRFTILLVFVFLVSSCTKEVDETDEAAVQANQSSMGSTPGNILDQYTGLSSQTLWELQQARAATARYRNIANAIKDGYADIAVVVPNMGHHYLKAALLDGEFDIRKPEILVYNRNEEGAFELVAVEYAIPLQLSAEAPAGFTGTADVWDRNTGFGLWLLHAWVWSYNPQGVFNPTNPLVHLH